LTWYNPPELHAGDVWQVTAKVRPPWSYQNPGGFDYERWLLSEHLHGTLIRGYFLCSSESAATVSATFGVVGPSDFVAADCCLLC
jgi:competence protein ComEC